MNAGASKPSAIYSQGKLCQLKDKGLCLELNQEGQPVNSSYKYLTYTMGSEAQVAITITNKGYCAQWVVLKLMQFKLYFCNKIYCIKLLSPSVEITKAEESRHLEKFCWWILIRNITQQIFLKNQNTDCPIKCLANFYNHI